MKLTSDAEFQDIECPVKCPRLVREFGNIFVLNAILLLPTSCVGVALIANQAPPHMRGAVGLTLVGICFIAWLWLPVFLAKKKTSRWLLEVIQHHINESKDDEAIRISSKYSAAIAFPDFQAASWFQSFLRNNAVRDPRGVYERYFARLSDVAR
jgi:hypothetical protein